MSRISWQRIQPNWKMFAACKFRILVLFWRKFSNPYSENSVQYRCIRINEQVWNSKGSILDIKIWTIQGSTRQLCYLNIFPLNEIEYWILALWKYNNSSYLVADHSMSVVWFASILNSFRNSSDREFFSLLPSIIFEVEKFTTLFATKIEVSTAWNMSIGYNMTSAEWFNLVLFSDRKCWVLFHSEGWLIWTILHQLLWIQLSIFYNQ